MQNTRTVAFNPPLVMPLAADAGVPNAKERLSGAKKMTAAVTLESWIDPVNRDQRVFCDRCFTVETADAELTVAELVQQVADEWQRLAKLGKIDKRRNELKSIDIHGAATCQVHFTAPAGTRDGAAVGRLDPHARYGLE